jgi:galactokinase
LNTSFQSHDPPLRLLAAFQQAFPDQAMDWVIRAPGRDMWLAASHCDKAEFTIVAPDMGALKATFSLQSAKVKRSVMQRPLPPWARYPAGVTLLLAQDGLDVVGLNMVVIGDEPPGPRYNYALGMTFAALWHDLLQLPYTMDDLIALVDRTRREYLGEEIG